METSGEDVEGGGPEVEMAGEEGNREGDGEGGEETELVVIKSIVVPFPQPEESGPVVSQEGCSPYATAATSNSSTTFTNATHITLVTF